MVLYPLPTPVQTQFSPGAVFHARRPWEQDEPQTRWHAGLDLKASEGMPVLAPEAGEVVDGDRGWDGTALATVLHTASGRTLLFGCTAKGSSRPKGTKVQAGDMVAAIGFYTQHDSQGNPIKSSMLHLQVYDQVIPPGQLTVSRTSWKLGGPMPAGLVDPKTYLAGAQEVPDVDVPNDQPPGEGVSAEGGLSSKAPCTKVDGIMVCTLGHVSSWVKALKGYRAAAEPVLVKANKLVLEDKVGPWTPAASAAVDDLGDADVLINDHENGDAEGLPEEQVSDLVSHCRAVKDAKATLEAFVAKLQGKPKPGPGKPKPGPNPGKPKPGPNPPGEDKPKKSGGGGAVLAGVGILVLAGIGVAAASSSRRKGLVAA